MQVPMLDKMIHLHFRRLDGSVAHILTPETGRKPTIRLEGTFVTKDLLQQVELRLTNFTTDVPLSEYGTLTNPGYVSVEAGYRGFMSTAFTGQIVNSYQELPGPDGVTMFQLVVGNADRWASAVHNAAYKQGTSLRVVLDDLAKALGMNAEAFGIDDVLEVDFQYTALANAWFQKLRQLFPDLKIQCYGDRLIAFHDSSSETGKVYKLDYVSHAKHSAAGFDIQAPWVPGLVPGDILEIDPKFFRQDLGGSTITPGTKFRVYLVGFEFCTTDDTNSMSVLTVGAA